MIESSPICALCYRERPSDGARHPWLAVRVLAIHGPGPNVIDDEPNDIVGEMARLLAELGQTSTAAAQAEVAESTTLHICGTCFANWWCAPVQLDREPRGAGVHCRGCKMRFGDECPTSTLVLLILKRASIDEPASAVTIAGEEQIGEVDRVRDELAHPSTIKAARAGSSLWVLHLCESCFRSWQDDPRDALF